MMLEQERMAAQSIKMDYGDEVPYAFDFLPENKRLNDEMRLRAINRSKRTGVNNFPRPGWR